MGKAVLYRNGPSESVAEFVKSAGENADRVVGIGYIDMQDPDVTNAVRQLDDAPLLGEFCRPLCKP